VIGILVRSDESGLTSVVRGVGLGERGYESLLKHFRRVSCDVTKLTMAWRAVVLKTLGPQLYRVGGRIVQVVDSTKVEKTGRRMPGVKALHSGGKVPFKAERILGHHVHVASVLAEKEGQLTGIPLVGRLCEGIKLSPSDACSVREKMVAIEREMGRMPPSYVVGDRYYASSDYIRNALLEGHEVVCRVRSNAVCRTLLNDEEASATYCGRGRRPKFSDDGIKVAVRAETEPWHQLPCPWDNQLMKVASFVAYWPPLKCNVLWVVAWHSSHRSPFIVLSTDLTLTTHDVLHKLYAPRWSIETAFMPLKHEIGISMYRFWSSAVDRPRKVLGNLYLHRLDETKRQAILKKMVGKDKGYPSSSPQNRTRRVTPSGSQQ
jgi:hypothetical protein